MFHVLAKDEGPFEKVLHLMGRTTENSPGTFTKKNKTKNMKS